MTTPATRNPWVRNFHPAPNARTRLLCFPHAGGSASYFFPLSSALAPEFDVYAVQYPGRQDRYTEALIDDIDDMADQAYEALEPLIDAPVALFGHSMGAVLRSRSRAGSRRWPGAVPCWSSRQGRGRRADTVTSRKRTDLKEMRTCST